ncbi:MAG: excinuclease ABC subunit UvrC [Dethiobacteria bacterium]
MEDKREFLLEQVQQLPRSPGVYLYKDERGRVIYVGKALDLRQRVRSYFQNSPSNSSYRLKALVGNIASISYIVTDSEEEAFMLESNLIKEYSPRYNIQFKDDKHYPYLRLTTEETFPRLEVARRVDAGESRYFGPYSNAGSMRDTMRLIKKLFPLRSCRQELREAEAKGRPCLNYQIKRCLAPCRGNITSREYNRVVEQVTLFLEGRQLYLLKKIEREMAAAANALQFEKAARLRDQHFSLQRIMERQKAVTTDLKDRDVIALVEIPGGYTVGLFRVREGKLLGAENFTPRGTEEKEAEEIMKEFLRHYYDKSTSVPGELLLSHMPADKELITQWLKKKRNGKGIKMKVPLRGEKKALLELVKKNAFLHARHKQEDLQQTEVSLKELGRLLGLDAPPVRIEGYDISHFAGKDTVGSMVVFLHGRAVKDEYRRFKIRTADPADDYAALAEVLHRRLQNEILPLPSLILLDGGRGQLSAGLAVLRETGYGDLPVIALAEEHEHIFLPGQKAPLVLPAVNPALKLLQRVRDEAHRFAITFSRNLAVKRSLSSFLQGVPGIGKVRRKALLEHFSDMGTMMSASLEEIKTVPKMNGPSAERLYRELQRRKNQ